VNLIVSTLGNSAKAIARLAKVTALIISRDVVIDYALYGTPELALVANNKAEILQFRGR